MTIEYPKTREDLMLFLYSPMPGYALVCVDVPGESRSASPALEKVAKELGDERNNIDIKFLVCFSENREALAGYHISSCPTYLMFKCGSNFKELGRLSMTNDAKEREGDGTGAKNECNESQKALIEDQYHKIRTFAVTTINQTDGKTLYETIVFDNAKRLMNEWLKSIGKESDLSLCLDKKGECMLNIKGNDILVRVSQVGGCHLFGYAGDESLKSDNAALVKEVMCWNFEADFLKGCFVSVQRKTGRFVMRSIHSDLAVSLNEVKFNNLIQNFGGAINACAGEMKKLIEESANKKEDMSIQAMRELRLSKFSGAKDSGGATRGDKT